MVLEEELGRLYPADYAPHAVKAPAAGPAAEGFLVNERIDADLVPLGPGKRILDIGCGNGKFLHRMKESYGCEVEGLDFSAGAVEAARRNYGLPVRRGTLEDAPFEPASFNAVTAWWYLEHVPDPFDSLTRMSSFLGPGGCLVIGVPNSRSLAAKVFGSRWYHLDCPRHLYLFTPKSMRLLLEKAGLRLERIRFDKSAWGMAHSVRYALHGKAGKKDNHSPGAFLLRQALLPLCIGAGLLHFGDTLVVHARKRAP